MASEQFRRQLRREAEQWRIDGLIEPGQYEQLAAQYDFDALETGARDRFVVILLGLGCILLGLGVITFVAANWQAIPHMGKMVLLFSLFVAANAAGFYLWRRPKLHGRERWQHRLGHGLLLLGALVLGANLALAGQLFHRSGAFYELCLVWGLGVLAMAFGLRLRSLALLSILLMGVGYWSGMWEATQMQALGGLNGLMSLMPLVAGGLFTLLAYQCRSKVIFALGAIATVSALLVTLSDVGNQFSGPAAPGFLVAIACTLPPALLWSYDDALWWRLRNAPLPLTRPFRPVAQAIALIFLTATCYGFSFRSIWTPISDQPSFSQQVRILLSHSGDLLLNPNLFVYTALMLIGWFYLAYPRHRGQRWGLSQHDAVMLVFLLTVGLIPLWHWGVAPIQAIATYLFNVLLFLLSAAFIRQGLAQGSRSLFWYGMVMLVLQIISRMLEYETGLLLKSAVFALCGLAVLFVGLWFERHVRTLAPAATLTPASQEETV
ncbi:DUF2157 domain-containing protein [Thermoleptolyngbya sp. C42_A2020_037]|uniref:DUF2157 domain-containing protein n=1 Tax=Thermoleptolyngbya sp. C42_A2020_037 TaxID=2747799 RepID=UPI0019ECF9A9|nr:DUF2157 domain-containing protein [Thermoleptolyngbya sp. C42_A2020_037]MBF2085539.1 DUF2157 domain-containing protein [Thermoleptolyngbya sp. C42_A2020_037]